MAQVWLVTGSSRGLGRAIVEAGLAAGNKVLATARDIKSLADLSERYGDQVKLFAMDVTDVHRPPTLPRLLPLLHNNRSKEVRFDLCPEFR